MNEHWRCVNNKRSTLNVQLPTINHQPSTINHRPSTRAVLDGAVSGVTVFPGVTNSVSPNESARFLARRDGAQRLHREKHLERARCDAQAIVRLIVERYRPRRVYQWGSLLDARKFGTHSDIDIAVEGITAAETFFNLYGEADRLTSFSLDLVALERIEPEFAEVIRQKGKLVYEQGS